MEARGDELVAQAAPAGSIEWFASVDGTPIGPLTTDEIVSRISTGVLAWDAHVWREGYAEWMTVDSSDTLVRAVASSRGAIDDEPRGDSTERTSLPPNGAPHYESDAYEQDARTMNVDAPTIAALDDSPTRIAFDETPTRMYSGHSAPPGSLQPVARSSFASRPPGSIAPVTRPVLGESSPNVMASAAPYSSPSIEVSRAQLTGGPMPLPSSASRGPASVPPTRGGYAGGEGSGLIDIRALASLAQTRMNAPQQQPRTIAPPRGNGSDYETEQPENDPLASFGTGHGVAFAALDSLAPVANREQPKDKTVPLAILVGFAMVAAAAFAAVYITRQPVLAPPVAAASQPSAPVAAPEPVAPAAAAQPPAPVEQEPAAPAAAAPAAPAEEREQKAEAEPAEQPAVAAVPAKTARGKRPGARKAREANAAADPLEAEDDEPALAKTEEKEKAPPPTVDDILLGDDKPAEKEKAAAEEKPAAKPAPVDRSIDDLLDTAVAKKAPAGASAAPAAAAGQAEAPSRADVLSAMRKIEGEVRACAASEATPVTGTANVAITVSGATGKVTNAEVSGLTGPVGSCIARVARNASFAPFTREKFSVTYPYRFK
jgi:hypothetical protein